MKRSEHVARMLERYGNPVTIVPKNGAPLRCRAMIQPLSLHRMPDSDAVGVVGGNRDGNGMLYLGPASCRLDQFPRGTTVQEAGGTVYRVIDARCICLDGAPLYVHAILQETVKEEGI